MPEHRQLHEAEATLGPAKTEGDLIETGDDSSDVGGMLLEGLAEDQDVVDEDQDEVVEVLEDLLHGLLEQMREWLEAERCAFEHEADTAPRERGLDAVRLVDGELMVGILQVERAGDDEATEAVEELLDPWEDGWPVGHEDVDCTRVDADSVLGPAAEDVLLAC